MGAENFFFDSTKEVEKFIEGISSTFKIQKDGTKYCG